MELLSREVDLRQIFEGKAFYRSKVAMIRVRLHVTTSMRLLAISCITQPSLVSSSILQRERVTQREIRNCTFDPLVLEGNRDLYLRLKKVRCSSH